MNPERKRKMVRIAIVKLSAMGDIVHAMAVLQFIRRDIPDASIDWVVEEVFSDLLANNPDIGRILPVRLKALKKCRSCLFSEIRKIREYAKNSYDIVIDLQGLIKSGVISRMLGFAAGFDRNSIREKAASFFYRKSFYVPYEENVIYRNMKLVNSALGIDVKMDMLANKAPFLFFEESERDKTAPFLHKEHKNIVYILGSSWKSKIYPKEKLVGVIEKLGENALLAWGNEEERESALFVANHSDASILPKLTLGELKALISQADLVIGGDSGPTHFAWALNVPSITLYGPTPSQRNTLEGKYTKVLSSSSAVDPLKLDKNDFSISEIEPERIAELGIELLDISRKEAQIG